MKTLYTPSIDRRFALLSQQTGYPQVDLITRADHLDDSTLEGPEQLFTYEEMLKALKEWRDDYKGEIEFQLAEIKDDGTVVELDQVDAV